MSVFFYEVFAPDGMDFGEFSDVSLDTTDTNDFKSCDNSISDVETSSVWPNGLANLQCANNSTTTSNNNLNHNSVASRQADAFGVTSMLTAQSLQKNRLLGRHQSLAGEDVFSERRRRLSSWPSSPPQVPLSNQKITSNSPEPHDIDYSKYDDFGSSEGVTNVKVISLVDSTKTSQDDEKINDLDAVRQSEVKPQPRQIYERAKSLGCPEQQYSDEDEQAEIRRRRFGSECESEASAATSVASSAWTETGSDENRAGFIKPDLAKQASRASLDELLFDLYDGQGGEFDHNYLNSHN